MTSYRIEKRVANTPTWGVVGRADTREQAIAQAEAIEGGKSTGVRIVRDGDPYAIPEVVVGDE